MSNQYTVPNPSLQATPAKKQPRRQPPRHNKPYPASRTEYAPHGQGKRPPRTPRRKWPMWMLLGSIGVFASILMGLVGIMVLLQLSFVNKILPKVEVAGIAVGNMSVAEAIQVLNTEWTQLYLTDGNRRYAISPSDLGITLDAQRSAERAFAQGHGEGGWIAHLRPVSITPVMTIDASTMNMQLAAIASEIEQPAKNAGVALVNGQVVATDPVYGTMIDIGQTINRLQSDPSLIADGSLELVMLDVAPTVMDARPLVAQAESRLSSPLDIRVFDPVTGDAVYWSVLSETWSRWLTATSDPNSPIGLSLAINDDALRQYLSQQAATELDSTRTLDLNAAVNSVQAAFASGRPQEATVTIQHTARTHAVQAGETLTSIAWDYGIPYLYIIEANGGVESVNIGQQITIPPADMFISDAFNPNKRIVVSISQQRTYVYENGQLLYEWASSTGIDSSPTWPGVYQVISHVPNAYAANWNLYMPNFIGVYQPVPGADFTNGFHGFPTRGGGQLLWENSLGRRVTYGCILLSDTHIAILYEWAEDGVIVDIQA